MVAMNVWPTDAADGSVASEARWRKMARHWAGTGVCRGVGLEMAPSLSFPNLTVRNGACWVDGHFCELLSDQVLTVTANGIVVVRFDPAANTAELIYRDGVTTPAQSPTGVYEMLVAGITGGGLWDGRPMQPWSDSNTELVYHQITSVVSSTATTPAGAVIAINPNKLIYYDGRPILVEVYAPSLQVNSGTPGAQTFLNLWSDASDLGYVAQLINPGTGTLGMSGVFQQRITPTPGWKNYSVRMWVSVGTATLGAGDGTGGYPPAHIRITRI